MTLDGPKLWTNSCGHGSFPGYSMWVSNDPADTSIIATFEQCTGWTGGSSILDSRSSVYGSSQYNCAYGPFIFDPTFGPVAQSALTNPAASYDEDNTNNAAYDYYSYTLPTCNNCAGYPSNCGPGSTCGCACCGDNLGYGGYGLASGFGPIQGYGYSACAN
eukprot:g1994.t1